MMTLEQFLTILESTQGDWIVTSEGYLRRFVKWLDTEQRHFQWDTTLTAVARLAGRNYAVEESTQAGKWLSLDEDLIRAIIAADKGHNPGLRAEIDKRVALGQDVADQQHRDAKDAEIAALEASHKLPGQAEPGKEQQQWSDYLKREKLV